MGDSATAPPVGGLAVLRRESAERAGEASEVLGCHPSWIYETHGTCRSRTATENAAGALATWGFRSIFGRGRDPDRTGRIR